MSRDDGNFYYNQRQLAATNGLLKKLDLYIQFIISP